MVLYLVVHGADCAPTADRVSRKVQLMAKSRDNFAQKIGGLSVHKLSHGRQTQTSRVGPFTNFMFITQSFSVSGGWEVIAQDIFQDILAFIFTTPPIVSPTQGTPYALPYRRYVGVLTDANARLGADVDRYTFIVVDLHHLLLPVSRRTSSLTTPATQSGLPLVAGGPPKSARKGRRRDSSLHQLTCECR